MGGSEEDVSAQLVDLYAFALHSENGSLGNRPDPVASVLPCGEPGLDRIHSRQSGQQEDDQDQGAHTHPDKEPEEHDRQEDQQDDRELRPGQVAADPHQPGLQQGGAGEQQHAADQRRRHQADHGIAGDRHDRDEEGDKDAGQAGIGPEHQVAQ